MRFLLDSAGGILYTETFAASVFNKEPVVRAMILGTVFALFIICFVAIIVEESLLGGRRRRRKERELKERRSENNPGC